MLHRFGRQKNGQCNFYAIWKEYKLDKGETLGYFTETRKPDKKTILIIKNEFLLS